jgi:hypothetical protein
MEASDTVCEDILLSNMSGHEVLGRSGGRRGPPTWVSGRSDALLKALVWF